MEKVPSILLIFALLVILGATAVSAADDPIVNATDAGTHPIMHPNLTTLQRWTDQYEAAEPVQIDPVIRNRAIQSTGVQSLLSEVPYTAAERDQNPIGNCWVWAGTGVLEVAHSKQDGIRDRLSIQYLDSNYNGGSGPDWAGEGGTLTDFVTFYNRQRIAVPWSNLNADFQDGRDWCSTNMQTWVSASSIRTDPHYNIASIAEQRITTRSVDQATAIANIKAVLDQGQAIYLSFKLPDAAAWNDFNTFWDTKGENAVWDPSPFFGRAWNSETGGGHAVLCVGYDDTDPNNRYWILLNSWGTADGKRPHGTFRMKMNIDYGASYPAEASLPAMQWETESVRFNGQSPAPTIATVATTVTPSTLDLSPAVTSMKSGADLSLDLNITPSKNGISGYILSVTSDNPAVATITRATLPVWAEMPSTTALPSSNVTIRGWDIADLIRGGTEPVTLARLEIAAGTAGTARLTIRVTSLSDDRGVSIPTTTVPAVITVEDPVIPGVIAVPPLAGPPTDPDQDGLYEDLNGNGALDFNDVTLFFNQMDWIADHEPVSAFDFNRNGQIDFGDIVVLFNSF